jgi:hypothetical protein
MSREEREGDLEHSRGALDEQPGAEEHDHRVSGP